MTLNQICSMFQYNIEMAKAFYSQTVIGVFFITAFIILVRNSFRYKTKL